MEKENQSTTQKLTYPVKEDEDFGKDENTASPDQIALTIENAKLKKELEETKTSLESYRNAFNSLYAKDERLKGFLAALGVIIESYKTI